MAQTCTEHTAHAATIFFANGGNFRAASAAQQHTVINGSIGQTWQVPLTATMHESDSGVQWQVQLAAWKDGRKYGTVTVIVSYTIVQCYHVQAV